MRISEALRKAFLEGEGTPTKAQDSPRTTETTTEIPTTTPTRYKPVPVAPPTSAGDRNSVAVSDVLRNVLRPRIVGRSGKANWEKTLERFRKAYDYLVYFIHKGEIRGEEKAESFDLVEAFYQIFPEARDAIRSTPIFVQDYLVNIEDLERALDPKNYIYKTYFSRLVEIPGVSKVSARRGGSPQFSRLQEEVKNAYRAIYEPSGGENYREILRRFLEAYLSYAMKLPSLPKPEVEG